MQETIFGYTAVILIILIVIVNGKIHDIRHPESRRQKKQEKPIKPVISKDPVIDETPIGKDEDPRYKDFINAQWDEMNK